MEIKKLVLATAMVSALGGLYGCSGDETVEIVIDAQDNSVTTSTTTAGGSSVDCPTDFSFERTLDDVDYCQLDPQLLSDVTLTKDIPWLINGAVIVGNGNQTMSATDGVLDEDAAAVNAVTLTIEEGTEVFGQNGTFANITITRGSEIMAVGTAAEPIIFSSSDEGYEGSGEWGGLILHGYGLHNVCEYVGVGGSTITADAACNIDAEGESGKAGGHDTTDSSGSLEYVVVAEGGYEFAVGNEINGISFVAVGSGTTVENVQVLGNADDGVEFYGGSVNAKNLVLVNNADDSIDWDEGYTGSIQYAIVKQATDGGDFGIEADTQGTTTFLSVPTVMNATFIMSGAEEEAHMLKKASGGYIFNSVITSNVGATLDFCVNVGASAEVAIAAGSVVYQNIVADCAAFETSDSATESTVLATNGGAVNVNVVADVALSDMYASGDAAATGLTAFAPATVSPEADASFLDETTYAGAVDPAATSAWYEGWIIEGSL